MISSIKSFFRYYLLSILIKLFGAFLIGLSSLLGIEAMNEISSTYQVKSDYLDISTVILLTIVIYPIMEEVAFRGWMKSNKIIQSASVSLLVMYTLFIVGSRMYSLGLSNNLFSIGLLLSGFTTYTIASFYYIHVKKTLEQNFTILFWASIGYFAFIHELNYQIGVLNFWKIISIFFLIIPHFLSGYLFAQVRLKHNLLWSISLHILGNTSVMIFAYWSKGSI